MRKILFKGLLPNKTRWEQGFLEICDGVSFISGMKEIMYRDGVEKFLFKKEVLPESVSQFTNITDKNDTDIWEKDLVKLKGYTQPCEVIFHHGAWCLLTPDNKVIPLYTISKDIEVVGNVMENSQI